MKNYGSIQQATASSFVKHNAPGLTESSSWRQRYCPSPTLAGRFILRNSIPLALGMLSGLSVHWITKATNGPSFIAHTDFFSCFITLLAACGTDYLLDRCWPARPYTSSSAFFPVDGGAINGNPSANVLLHESIPSPV